MHGITFTALSLASAVAAFPAPRSIVVERGVSDTYNRYQGDGSAGAGWPDQNSWGSWDELWNANVPLMRQSCGWNGWGADNTDDEINGIGSAINQVSGETGVDSRYILAIVMQESKGCTRVPTTNNGVTNPGLMQSHNGSGSCFGQSPCPQDQILQMIRDGTAGTSNGDGLKQTHEKAAATVGDGSRAWYAAARLFNSGSVDYNDLNNGLGSTGCYTQDIANRLTGWTLAQSNCWA